MTTSSLLRRGSAHMRSLVDGLSALLNAREIESPGEIRGRMSRERLAGHAAFERENYIRMLQGYRLP